jgi:hypothetical protein
MSLVGAGLMLGLVVSGCSKSDTRMSSDTRTSSGTRTSMATAGNGALTLSGTEEVPPVQTQASGTSSLTVVGDKTLVGRVETKGINATAAHVHQGAKGQNGPPIVTLVKAGDNAWVVPSNVVLTSAQFAAYKAGELYVNVHSAAHPNGEIRVQLKP